MKRFFSFLLLILIFSCSQDLHENSESSKYGGISGVVADRATGDPVSVVQLTLKPSGKTTVTGTDGSYNFQNIEPGEYSITTEKLGYRQSENITTVVAGQTSECHLLVERIPAVITADVEELDFGKELSNNSMSFNIVNEYYEDLNWHIEYNCDWIESVVPAKGTCTHGKTASVVVNVNRFYSKNGNNETRLTVVSDNGQGSSEVKVKLYNILSSEAKVETLDATDVGKDHATLNGKIISSGSPQYTEKGFVFSKASNPTIDNCIKRIPVSSSEFSTTVDELELNVVYYVRAYALHDLYIVYGNAVPFETNDGYKKFGSIYVQLSDIGQGGVQAMDQACYSSRVGGLSGWRLPSLAELGYLYQNREKIGGFRSGSYWSSEVSTSYEWTGTMGSPYTYYTTTYYYSFYSGSSGSIKKSSVHGYVWPENSYYARCVK
jgi:hypothetical protein